MIVAGVLWARGASGSRRSAILGATTGCAFGLTAALMKGMTNEFSHGLVALFTGWQLWAVVTAGGCATFLWQSAIHAGRLLAAQPGPTMADPVVAILWGTPVLQERVRGGLSVVPAIAAAAVVVLSRSPLFTGEAGHREEARPDGPGDRAAPRARDS